MKAPKNQSKLHEIYPISLLARWRNLLVDIMLHLLGLNRLAEAASVATSQTASTSASGNSQLLEDDSSDDNHSAL